MEENTSTAAGVEKLLVKEDIAHSNVDNYVDNRKYVDNLTLNGKVLDRLWITQEEIMKGGELVITTSDQPNKTLGQRNIWRSDMNATVK